MDASIESSAKKPRGSSASHTASSQSHAQTPHHSTGLPRPRSSSKRKDKKNLSGGVHGARAELSAHGPAVEQRLRMAQRTKRLDLSLPRQAHAQPEAPIRANAARMLPFQIFPPLVVLHERQGHHLTELWLTNHHLNSLPAEIALFTGLRVLGLAGNALPALPEELGQLPALEALYLEKNRLQTMAASVAFPSQLRELRLDNNQLSVFPLQITKLRLLNRLGISHNQLKALPAQVQRLRNLVELDMDFNRISSLPDEFAALQRLERLGLEGNFLPAKPSVLDRLPTLHYVRLSGNRSAKFLPATSGAISALKIPQLAVPRRHDGYFRCVEAPNKSRGDNEAVTNEKSTALEEPALKLLEGLVPCQDQNLLNAEVYVVAD